MSPMQTGAMSCVAPTMLSAALPSLGSASDDVAPDGQVTGQPTVGELRRGVELIRHRGDNRQANQLESWLSAVLDEFSDWILDVDTDVAQVWGALRCPRPENALDKLIAATALVHNLAVVTRNHRHFVVPGVEVLNPFSEAPER